jgi:dTMP kinase
MADHRITAALVIDEDRFQGHIQTMKSRFITLEGGDGAGKSTLLARIENFLKEKDIKYVLTREPGGTPVSEEIREILLKPGRKMEPLTELMLYLAARAEHVETFIKPKLREGYTVLCDRFSHSTLAYQGAGRGLGIPTTKELNQLACQGLKPDAVLWLRISKETAKKRRRDRGALSRLDAEAEDFHSRVHKAFSELAEDPQNSFIVLDAEKSPEGIEQELFANPQWHALFDRQQKKGVLSWFK